MLKRVLMLTPQEIAGLDEGQRGSVVQLRQQFLGVA